MTPEALKALRKKPGMRQEEFGKTLGYSNPQIRISELERGTGPYPRKLRSFADTWTNTARSSH